MRLALVLHPDRQASKEVAGQVMAAAADRGMAVVGSPQDAVRLDGLVPWEEPGPTPDDVVVAVGGDGTVLEAARQARAAEAAVFGVNAGTVGFLAEVDPPHIGDALDALGEGRFTTSERMTLEAMLPDGSSFDALNDVVVEKAVSRHVVKIEVSVAGQSLAHYRTDAVIVATPTGSTAYSFSAGGPLMEPELEALIVTAVAPHNLFGRSLVFAADTPLTLTISGDRSARLNVDGRHGAELAPGDRVEVRKGDRAVRLIRFTPSHFAQTVKEKFHLHDA